MFSEYDLVRFKPTGETYIVIVIDEGGDGGVIYGIELEDQFADDWFRWCAEDELELVGE